MKQLITLTAIILSTLSCFSQTKEQDSLTIQLAYQKQDSTKVETSIQLIKSFFHSQDYKKALLYIDQSEKLSTILKYHSATAEIKYYKALIYAQNDDYFNALDNYNTALRLFTQLEDPLGVARVKNSLALIEIKRGNYNKGLRYSLSAIDVFEQKNLYNELSRAYGNLAEAYFNTNQNDNALDFNLKALRIREQLNDSAGVIISTKNIASLYSVRKEHRKAIEYYEKLLVYLESSKEQHLKAEILPLLGAEYLQFNDFDNATTYLLSGLKLNRKLKRQKGILKSLNSLSLLNFKLGKIRLAEYQLDEASKLIENVNDPRLELENLNLRVRIDSTNGNFKTAFNTQRAYQSLKDKLDLENAKPVFIEEEPIENINDANALITPEQSNINPDQNQKYKRTKLYAYILVILLAIMLILFIMLFIKHKKDHVQTSNMRDQFKTVTLENASLLEQTQHLEEMNQVKDRLFSIVSHDLKDSITGVKAFLDLLKEDSISREEFNELIPELSDNADNAAALLMNLLNWSKSQMQNLDPKPETFNIQEVFAEKMHLIEKKVEQKRIILLDESIKQLVYADRSMIEIVIQNLLANAVKFSRVGDVITVSNRDRNGKILICIEDTGVGISKENQAKLFKNGGFTTRGTGHEKGTGLGLSICKQLVELNQGTIRVESEPNLGSKFYVELPKAKAV